MSFPPWLPQQETEQSVPGHQVSELTRQRKCTLDSGAHGFVQEEQYAGCLVFVCESLER